MKKFYLTPSTLVNIIQTKGLDFAPRWNLLEEKIRVETYNNNEDNEYISKTLGSAEFLWEVSDIVRFDKESCFLSSLQFNVPQNNVKSIIPKLKNREYIIKEGMLQLSQKISNFSLEPASIRYYDSKLNRLICLIFKEITDDIHLIRVGLDLDLIFYKHCYNGWQLNNPEHYIVSSWDETVPNIEDKILQKTLENYLEVFTYDNVNLMIDEDQTVKTLLLDLKEFVSTKKEYSNGFNAIYKSVSYLLNEFYND